VSLGFSSKRVLYFVFCIIWIRKVFVSFGCKSFRIFLDPSGFCIFRGSHPRGFRIFWIRQVFVGMYVLITDSIVRTYFVDRVRRSRIHDGFRPWSMSILLDGWVDECGSRSLPNQPQPHNRMRTKIQLLAQRTKQRRSKESCQADSRSPQHSPIFINTSAL
jgi:hypothetical protein